VQPTKIAALSIFSNGFVTILKIIVGFITGSVAVLSEAIHSSLDLLASAIAFFSVKISRKPPDRDHPYGHGKVENVSGTIETLLIFVAGIWIISESIHKWLEPEPLQLPLLGVGAMLLGAAINLAVGLAVKRTGEQFDSVAMRSNALHLLTDVYTSLGVAVSLLLVSLTQWWFLDPLIGILLALYIMKEAFRLGKQSFMPLLDTSLSEDEQAAIRKIIESYQAEFIEYHDLRTRRAGAEKHIDFHLVVPSHLPVEQAHALCDRIEAALKKHIQPARILIHLEPEHERTDKPPR